jgi:DNA-binding NarL/FixJ family response regulator
MLGDARRMGSVIVHTAARSMQALVNWRRGRIADAEEDCSTALALSEESEGTDALVNAARAIKALVSLARGADATELERIESEVLDRSRDPDALPYHLVLHARGLVRLERGDHARGLEDLLACGEVSVGWGSGNPTTVPWRSDAALALARAGEREEALRLATEELELAKEFGARRAVGIAQRALGLVVDDASTIPMLRAAVESLQAAPGALDLTLAMTDLAAAERRAGRRSIARETAVRAQDMAMRHGATALARRALEEALAAGARPRRVALKGVDALTPSEKRVARRAAEGQTNRAIAEELFITVKTVEMHLANAYAKLGVRSRTQLPSTLHEEPAA